MRIEYGISNVHVAIATLNDDNTVTYGAPRHVPGAVNLTLDVAGSETPFYADNIMYYSATSNQGYTGSMELAALPDWFNKEVMGVSEDGSGVMFENAADKTKYVALLYEVNTDVRAARRALMYVKCSRGSQTHATAAESVEPQPTTLNITASPSPETMDVRCSTTERTAAEVYNNWYKEVHTRQGVAVADATLSALALGSLTLAPEFASLTMAYTADTTNATNTITATASDPAAAIAITSNGTEVTNGSAITWQDGENIVSIKVTNGSETKTYTVTVTKA